MNDPYLRVSRSLYGLRDWLEDARASDLNSLSNPPRNPDWIRDPIEIDEWVTEAPELGRLDEWVQDLMYDSRATYDWALRNGGSVDISRYLPHLLELPEASLSPASRVLLRAWTRARESR